MLTDRMREYWNNAAGGELSGCDLARHLTMLNAPEVKSNDKVLCIGVGTGGWIEELWEQGCHTSALDISPVALRRVLEFAPGFVDAADLPHDFFDLALSHWVTPYMHLSGICQQIRGVVSSLKPKGLFAMHYNQPLGWWVDEEDPRKPVLDNEFSRLIDARSVITADELDRMVYDAGGVVIRHYKVHDAPKIHRTICVAHIGRA